MFPMSDSNSNVGIIGLGIMGSAIAGHLVARGNAVIGFDTCLLYTSDAADE